MKGIILAGGYGTRLYPLTRTISKHLLPVYDKPLVYYPLSVLMLAGIREVLIISTPTDLIKYQELFRSGAQLGMEFDYLLQDRPRGIAHALQIGKGFIGDDQVALILGDNILYGQTLTTILKEARQNDGATIFGIYTKTPERFGVLGFDNNGNVTSIEEKPAHPKSHFVVPGLYFYPNDVVELAENLKPSERGELEITDINNRYLNEGRLAVKLLGRGFAWFDSGTHDSLLESAHYISTIQNRQGLYIGCIEEIAFYNGWINTDQLYRLGQEQQASDYGKYLMAIAKER
jgi:glucose-1-phosphate thymidylyltransferase